MMSIGICFLVLEDSLTGLGRLLDLSSRRFDWSGRGLRCGFRLSSRSLGLGLSSGRNFGLSKGFRLGSRDLRLGLSSSGI